MNNKKFNITICIASDHAGYELKQQIIKYLEDNKNIVNDFGCESTESVDYPDYAFRVANYIKGHIDLGFQAKGILICGTGSGMVITANKVKHVRAVNCWNSNIAEKAVKHNNANILCLGARELTFEDAIKIIDTFFSTEFEAGRHQNRIDKIYNFTEK